MLRRFLRPVLIFLLSALWLSFLLPWNGFADPDAFYHAKLSWLEWQHGPIHAFPWLDLTLLARHPADLHLLFHLIVAPFTGLFGMFQGLRIASILLAALCIVVFDWAVRRLIGRTEGVINHAPTVLLLLSQPFLIRLLLAKATPLALIWFLVGLTAAWRRKPWLVFVAGLGFALSHAGWIYLAGSTVILAWGDVMYRRIVQATAWRDVIRSSMWRETLAVFAGAAVGMVVHPNFPQNVLLSWTQVVTIGLGTPFKHVLLGREWLPSEPLVMLASFAPWVMIGLIGLLGLILAIKKPLDHDRARLMTSLGWLLAAFLALTIKSRRNAEYLGPVVALWCASLWSLIDARRLREALSSNLEPLGRHVRRFAPWLVAVLFVVLLVRQATDVWASFHPAIYPDSVYRTSMSAISSRANPGDRVFHSSWDEFPMLFAADDRLRYISGLDPTFLYVASSTLSDDVRDVTWGVTTSTKEEVWALIHDQLQSRFVFVSKENHERFLDLLRSDPRYLPLTETTDSAAFEVSSR